MIKISIDVMGAETGIKTVINSAYKFVKINKDAYFFFVGNELEILPLIEKLNFPKNNFAIVNSTQKINSNDSIFAIRKKPDSSMIKAINLVKEDQCDVVISGGSTAIFLGACHLLLKEIPGIERPAFMPIIPNVLGTTTLFLDAGATIDAKPTDLWKFAHMAKIYSREIFKIENPVIGLLNIGEEETKGKDFQIETNKILKNDPTINFYGNIEPRYVFSGKCDVLLCDGYSGNVILKTFEGTAQTILGVIKAEFTKNIFTKIRALFVYSIFKKIKKRFNYKKYNGAFVIGLNKPAFKTHGSSDETSYYAVIEMAYNNIKNNVLNKIKEEIKNETK